MKLYNFKYLKSEPELYRIIIYKIYSLSYFFKTRMYSSLMFNEMQEDVHVLYPILNIPSSTKRYIYLFHFEKFETGIYNKVWSFNIVFICDTYFLEPMAYYHLSMTLFVRSEEKIFQ